MIPKNPEHIDSRHWEEIVVRSGVSELIARLNFRSVHDSRDVDRLLQLNVHDRWKHSDDLVPGWAASGVDPNTEEPTLLGVQYKPDTPPTTADGKPIKYMSAAGEPTQPTFLNNGVPNYWPQVLALLSTAIFLVEGVKKAGCLLTLAYAAVSLPGVWNGQLKGRLKTAIKQLCGLGRPMYLCFDSDQIVKPQVQQALDRLGRLLIASGCVVFVVVWDSTYKGIDDLLVGAGPEAVHEAISNALTFEEWRDGRPTFELRTKEKRKPVAEALIELGRTCDLYHDGEETAYADLEIDCTRHTYRLRSKQFKRWLTRRLYETEERAANSEAIQSALNVLEGKAIFEGVERKVWLRTAEHEGKFYLDLTNDQWQAIEIDPTGWRVVERPPVRFGRPTTALPIPTPIPNSSLDELQELLGLRGADWAIVTTFLGFCLLAGKTYPVLFLSAPRGSGKTTTAEYLKKLIDPGKAPLISLSADAHKTAVAGLKRWLMCYDNISHINPTESDCLCRLATGFGHSTRTLFTTDEETVFEVCRPQILTAIDHVVVRDDLADRTLTVSLPPIPEEKRKPKAELDLQFEQIWPGAIGALLDIVSRSLATMQTMVKPQKLPRMADYGLFAIAAQTHIGLKEGEAMNILAANRETARQVVIEASPLGEAVLRMFEKRLHWQGTASELLTQLENFADAGTVGSRYWPKASHSLTRQLNRLKPDLEALGIQIEESREGRNRTRLIKLERIIKVTSADGRPDQDENIASVASAKEDETPKALRGSSFSADAIADAIDPADAIADAIDPADAIADAIDPADAMRTLKNKIASAPQMPSQKAFPGIADATDAISTNQSGRETSEPQNTSSLTRGTRIRIHKPGHHTHGKEGLITEHYDGCFWAQPLNGTGSWGPFLPEDLEVL